MSALGRRRNRSLASCEPCRKSKVRCDHQKPICASCQRRGFGSECWYHPAPLTKTRSSHRTALPSPFRPNQITHDAHITTEDIRQNALNSPLGGPLRFHSWPFMVTEPNASGVQALVHSASDQKVCSNHLTDMMEIVSQLKFLPMIEKLLQDFYSFNQLNLVPKEVLLQLLASVRKQVEGCVGNTGGTTELIEIQGLTDLAKNVVRSSSVETTISQSLDVRGFCALFSGLNLRVETLGLIYTMTARAAFYCGNDTIDNQFIRDMGEYSNKALRLARDLAPRTTDLMVWLAHENLQLATCFEGDASLGVWRRLGDLATDLLALGLNREATYSVDLAPFFLSECRRRFFVTDYYLDKLFAMIFNRPPRITARYADCKLPLDLSDDDIFASTPEKLEQAKSNLSEDGWNMDENYRTATWARMRYVLSQFREEIVEYQYQSAQITDPAQLRCYETWNNLPRHLKYNQNCWESSLPPTTCYMHAKVYISYLHIHFQIYRLLREGDGFPSPELLEISGNMLETLIELEKVRNRGALTPRDHPGIILSYGLPCASVILMALEKVTQDNTMSLPPVVKSSVLIRNLSILVSQLENVSGPREVNQLFCLQASKAISRKLDNILDSLTGSNSLMSPDTSTDQSTTDIPRFHSTDSNNVSLHTMHTDSSLLDDFDTIDMFSWAVDSDLGASSSEWNLF
ncbi:hypothetical protein N7462_011601 [Penicillium macrosclerotiorum]|uniref:uncharacterized protein n=1 Tax=Penicillium macrosclerotiorum TaxID=303699 RepID=UPI002547C806|nr:uncharacterized protein N7462_011601 [Penicillium macrosclerotiorum]KAJ5662675.1 hypothetical protein N7462_011601 [Penicillium macrosclerotiorum]